jgi:uncharacterized protein (DUF2236 family)
VGEAYIRKYSPFRNSSFLPHKVISPGVSNEFEELGGTLWQIESDNMAETTLAAASIADRKRVVDQPRQDDGYFGPDSITWRLFSDPSSKLGGVAAILLQALNPYQMWLFDSSSYNTSDPQKRAERTARYVDTITFGDKAHADAAAESVRRIHANIRWD